MVSQLNWSEVITMLAVGTAAYYSALTYLFKRGRRMTFLDNNNPVDNVLSGRPKSALPTRENNDAVLFSSVHDLLEDLKSFWSILKQSPPAREELLHALQSLISRYPQLKHTAFEVAINNNIRVDAAEYCSVALDEHELKNIWIN